MGLKRDDVAGARVVHVRATVEFDAYVMPEDHETPGGYWGGSLDRRIKHELADAIVYRAPNLTDSEPGDALIAMSGAPTVAVVVVDDGVD